MMAAVVFAGCGGNSSGDSGIDTTEVVWKQGPAPGTGSDKWADLPAGTDINALCDEYQGGWPEEIESETQVTLQAGSERLVCVKAE